MSWDDSNYNKRMNRDNEDLDDVPFTGKKKKKVKRPFVLERMHASDMNKYYRCWRVVGKYETAELAKKRLDELCSAHKKGEVVIGKYSAPTPPKSLGDVVGTANVRIDGEIYEYYRILYKKD